MIYLDHAATTPPDAAVIRAMEQCMRDTWQNPSAAYAAAQIQAQADGAGNRFQHVLADLQAVQRQERYNYDQQRNDSQIDQTLLHVGSSSLLGAV